MKKLQPCCKRERARSLRIIATEARAREKIQTKEMAMGGADLRWAADAIKAR